MATGVGTNPDQSAVVRNDTGMPVIDKWGPESRVRVVLRSSSHHDWTF